MKPAPAQSSCSTCGQALDPTLHHGRCVRCLLAASLGPENEAESFGGHELIEEIARGGMGVVYRARQREPEREVALKTMRGAELDSPEALGRFRSEARAMADLDHPAILPVFTFGEHDGVPYFTMKLATGGTLAQRLGAYAGKWREIAELLASVADALQYAHARAVLHRDVKPANILFDESGRAYVSDFGIAKLLDSTDGALTHTAAVLGTPHYLAPEIAANDARAATTASDVWSLGVILYELLAQRRPFEGDSIPTLLRAITEMEPRPLHGASDIQDEVPRDLAVIAFKALVKDPARRFGSARELAEDLRRWLGGEPIRARPVARIERLLLWVRRKPALAALSLVAALACVAAVAALAWGFQSSRREVENVRAANTAAQKELRQALLDRARAGRNSRLAGWRASGLAALREAAALRSGDDLRDEAIAHLAGFDFEKLDGPKIPHPDWPTPPAVAVPRAFDFFFTLVNMQGDARRWPADRAGLQETPLRIPVQIARHRMSDGQSISLSPVLSGAHQRQLRTDPRGRWVVVGEGHGVNSGVLLLDAQSWQTRAHWPGGRTAGFSDDGRHLGLIERGQRVRILETTDLRDVGVMPASSFIPAMAELPGEPAPTLIVVSAPRGRREGIEVWDWQKGHVVARYPSDEWVTALAGKGEWLAAGTQQGNIRLINLRDQRVRTLAGGTNVIESLAFTSDGLLLASRSYDGGAILWQTEAAQFLVRGKDVRPVQFAADGQRFLTGGDIGYQWGKIAHSDGLRILADGGIGWGVTRLDFSPDGRWLAAVQQDKCVLFEAKTGRTLATVPLQSGWAAFFTADGQGLLLSEATGLCLARLAIDEGRLRILRERDVTPPGGKSFGFARLSANRDWIAVPQPSRTLQVTKAGDWTGWTSFTAVAGIPSYDAGRPDLAGDGQWVATGAFNNNDGSRVWHRDRPTEPHLLHVGNGEVSFSPDGRWLAVGSARDGLFVHESGTWRVVHREDLQNFSDIPPRLAWSPDGRWLVVGVGKRTPRLLDTGTWKVVSEFISPIDSTIEYIVFAPDGRTLAISRQSGSIELWDLTKLAEELAALGLPWELPPPVKPAPPGIVGPVKPLEPPPLFSAPASAGR